MKQLNHFAHQAVHSAGSIVLKKIAWKPDPVEMFKAPSRAKGGPMHMVALSLATAVGETVELLLDNALLAARIDHFIAIGGDRARDYFLGAKCLLDAQKIARLRRRMPPFILTKLEDLYAGSGNVDANPTGAFDTNGWGELRVRLPKFASMLQHYAHLKTQPGMDIRIRLAPLLEAIRMECDSLMARLNSFTPQGDGQERRVPQPLSRQLEWSKARVRFAQALVVFRKSNGDLASPHWRPEWAPTKADLDPIRTVVTRMKIAADAIAARLKVGASWRGKPGVKISS